MTIDPNAVRAERNAFLSAILAGDGTAAKCLPCPVVSLEGLPGAGKTTQLHRLLHRLREGGVDARELTLPADSGTAAFRRILYRDPDAFAQAAAQAPWLNPLLVTADLMTAMDRWQADPPTIALMSRGLVSTLSYAYPAFRAVFGDGEEGWEELFGCCAGFPYPSFVIVLDIDPTTSARRIASRGAPTLRPKDAFERLIYDHGLLAEVCRRVEARGMPVHRIDGSAEADEVTARCLELAMGCLNP